MDSKQLRSFGLIVGSIFALIGLWPAFWRGDVIRFWSVFVAGALLVPALLAPTSLRQPYRLWMTVGQFLGWINTYVLLGMVFYALLTPMAWLMRLLGKDPMRRRIDPAAASYRVVRQPRPHAHMTHQF